MIQYRVLSIICCFYLIFYGQFLIAQVLSKPDPNISIDASKGIILLYSASEGSLFLNDQFLTDLKRQDTLFIININPGKFTARFQNDISTISKDFIVDEGSVTKIIFRDSLLEITHVNRKWSEGVNAIRGNKYLGLLHMRFYSITEVGIINAVIRGTPEFYDNNHKVRSLNYFSTVNGYQFAPGFCLGFGVNFTFFDIPVYGYTSELIRNVSFMPLYVDIRAHFPQKGRVVPFLKLGLGHNFVLTQKSLYQSYPESNAFYLFKLDGGGIYASPGFGFRIMVTELIQVTASLDYSVEKIRMSRAYFAPNNNSYHEDVYNYQFIRFKIGIGLQY